MKSKILLLFSICFAQLNAQRNISINFSSGKNTSKYVYKINSSSKSTDFVLGEDYSLSIAFKRLSRTIIRPEIHFFQAGARSLYEDQKLIWRTNYIGLGMNCLYKISNKDSSKFEPYLGVGLNSDFLINGEQSVGINTYNLNNPNVISRFNLSSTLLFNLSYTFTEHFIFFFENRFNFGINNIEKDQNEKTRNIVNSFSLGFSVKL